MRLNHSLVAMLMTLMVAVGSFAFAGQIVETEEGLTYALPDGWSLVRFSNRDGSASFVHKPSGANLLVQRFGLIGKRAPYANKGALAGGRTLEWDYTKVEFDKAHVRQFLVGRVTLAEAHVEMSVTTKDMKGRVPQEMGLAAMRQVAQSANVTGPRRCSGSDCKPGVIKESK
jgi:hypothetical protein